MVLGVGPAGLHLHQDRGSPRAGPAQQDVHPSPQGQGAADGGAHGNLHPWHPAGIDVEGEGSPGQGVELRPALRRCIVAGGQERLEPVHPVPLPRRPPHGRQVVGRLGDRALGQHVGHERPEGLPGQSPPLGPVVAAGLLCPARATARPSHRCTSATTEFVTERGHGTPPISRRLPASSAAATSTRSRAAAGSRVSTGPRSPTPSSQSRNRIPRASQTGCGVTGHLERSRRAPRCAEKVVHIAGPHH